MIEVQNLTKTYGTRVALDDLTFDVKKGEILGFLGPNGAGKTTTMRILTGFMPATSGSAKVAGFDVFNQSLEARKRIGYLPESAPLYTDMTVSAYLGFMADLRGVKNRAERLNYVMEAVQITDRANQLIAQLSKGYRQRVGLAQALVHDPQVLVLDEPTVGLDPNQIIEVRELITSLAGERTVILSTHILPEVQAICSRVLIINKGRIVAEDTPERLTSTLQGKERVHIQLRSPQKQTAEMLGKIKDVLSVKALEDGTFEIDCELGKDRRDEIAKLVVNQNWGLLELRPVRMSLEDIFHQLTAEDEEEYEDEEYEDGAETAEGEATEGKAAKKEK